MLSLLLLTAPWVNTHAITLRQAVYKPEVPNLWLLTYEAMEEEFQFSRTQRKLAAEARSPRSSMGEQLPEKRPMVEKLVASLNPKQRQRLEELSIQYRWPDTLLSDLVSRKLELTPDQVRQIEILTSSHFGGADYTVREASAQGVMNDPAKAPEERIEGARIWRDASKRRRKIYWRWVEDQRARAMKLLTEHQAKSVQKLRGKEFPFGERYGDLRFRMRQLLADRHVQVELGFSLKESVEFFDAMEALSRRVDPGWQLGNQFFEDRLEGLSQSRRDRLRQITFQVSGAWAVLFRVAAEELGLAPPHRTALHNELFDLDDDERYDLFALDMQWRMRKMPDDKQGWEGEVQRQREREAQEAAIRSGIEVRRERTLEKALTAEQRRKWKSIQGRPFAARDVVRGDHVTYLF